MSLLLERRSVVGIVIIAEISGHRSFCFSFLVCCSDYKEHRNCNNSENDKYRERPDKEFEKALKEPSDTSNRASKGFLKLLTIAES